MVLAWVGGMAWLGLVLVDVRRPEGRWSGLLRSLDHNVRYVAVVGLWGVALYVLFDARPFGVGSNPKWLAAKVALYATAIACGLGIRRALRPFRPAFESLIASGSTPEVESALRRSIRRAEPYVFAIWACVIAAAVFGVVKPGAHLH